jgi:hypothetical protein
MTLGFNISLIVIGCILIIFIILAYIYHNSDDRILDEVKRYYAMIDTTQIKNMYISSRTPYGGILVQIEFDNKPAKIAEIYFADGEVVRFNVL